MGELPQITIVTPSYNQAEYLESTLMSVLNQGYRNLEYIVMDGGSTDGSVEIIRRYAHRLAHWESGPDQGQADAINRGFERGTGEILGWINSDDIMLPGCLHKVARWFVDHPDDEWVVGGTVYIDGEGKPIRGHRIPAICCDLARPITLNSLLFYGGAFSQPASFWRRTAYQAVGRLDASYDFAMDYQFYLRLASRRPSGHLPEYLACYRFHAKTKTSTMQQVRWSEHSRADRNFSQSLRNSLFRSIARLWYTAGAHCRVQYSRALHYLCLKRCPI